MTPHPSDSPDLSPPVHFQFSKLNLIKVFTLEKYCFVHYFLLVDKKWKHLFLEQRKLHKIFPFLALLISFEILKIISRLQSVTCVTYLLFLK